MMVIRQLTACSAVGYSYCGISLRKTWYISLILNADDADYDYAFHLDLTLRKAVVWFWHQSWIKSTFPRNFLSSSSLLKCTILQIYLFYLLQTTAIRCGIFSSPPPTSLHSTQISIIIYANLRRWIRKLCCVVLYVRNAEKKRRCAI